MEILTHECASENIDCKSAIEGNLLNFMPEMPNFAQFSLKLLHYHSQEGAKESDFW